MDIQDALRSIVTLLGFVAFIGIVVWAWSGARHKRFAEAARIPFDEDGVHNKTELQDSNMTKRTNSEKIGSEKTDSEKTGMDKTDTDKTDMDKTDAEGSSR